ncbi:hypothetical protein PY650_02810 [Rhizobium calliandrae]|uniref:Uncharacterized protein n=1 Tax=Rhizobium calliandrae TaxID=1312182 RepID=A0ABT7K7P2_9HYPH|nr:hypothetical protein [Rhizobium calliandrae]MDL2404602.1 hypothetical protein [Rhizobium calliandrae]
MHNLHDPTILSYAITKPLSEPGMRGRRNEDLLMKKHMISAALLLLGAAAPAFSQSLSALPLRNPHQLLDGYISVQSGISLSIPIVEGNDEKQQQDAIKSFYRIARKQLHCTSRHHRG